MLGRIKDKELIFGDDRFFVGSVVKVRLHPTPRSNFPYYKYGGIAEVTGHILSLKDEDETLTICVTDCEYEEGPCREKPNKITLSIFDVDDIKTARPGGGKKAVGYRKLDYKTHRKKVY